MAKKQSKFLVQQKIGIILFTITLVGIAIYLGIKTLEDSPLGEFVEGEHYQLLDIPRRMRSDKIEVMEFFSYGCVHCFDFEPSLSYWVDSKTDDINFVQVPAIANDYWRVLGRAYFTLEHMNILEKQHMAMFRAIHKSKRDLSNAEALFDFVEENGVDRDKFASVYQSPKTSNAMNQADQIARRLKVASVPTIVIQGKYLVRTTRSVGQSRMFEVMDYLIAKERTTKEVEQTKPNES